VPAISMRRLIYVGVMRMTPSMFGRLFAGSRPGNLGLHDGTLAPCPSKPNCVSSTATDRRHAIAPLTFTGAPDAALRTLQAVVLGLARTRVITCETNYLYVECTSQLLGFVDDVEFALDRQAKHLQVRSASRRGYSDFGVNRARIETIRIAFAAQQP
jgi:uncharacterized protein (DUF1499 family)